MSRRPDDEVARQAHVLARAILIEDDLRRAFADDLDSEEREPLLGAFRRLIAAIKRDQSTTIGDSGRHLGLVLAAAADEPSALVSDISTQFDVDAADELQSFFTDLGCAQPVDEDQVDKPIESLNIALKQVEHRAESLRSDGSSHDIAELTRRCEELASATSSEQSPQVRAELEPIGLRLAQIEAEGRRLASALEQVTDGLKEWRDELVHQLRRERQHRHAVRLRADRLTSRLARRHSPATTDSSDSLADLLISIWPRLPMDQCPASLRDAVASLSARVRSIGSQLDPAELAEALVRMPYEAEKLHRDFAEHLARVENIDSLIESRAVEIGASASDVIDAWRDLAATPDRLMAKVRQELSGDRLNEILPEVVSSLLSGGIAGRPTAVHEPRKTQPIEVIQEAELGSALAALRSFSRPKTEEADEIDSRITDRSVPTGKDDSVEELDESAEIVDALPSTDESESKQPGPADTQPDESIEEPQPSIEKKTADSTVEPSQEKQDSNEWIPVHRVVDPKASGFARNLDSDELAYSFVTEQGDEAFALTTGRRGNQVSVFHLRPAQGMFLFIRALDREEMRAEGQIALFVDRLEALEGSELDLMRLRDLCESASIELAEHAGNEAWLDLTILTLTGRDESRAYEFVAAGTASIACLGMRRGIRWRALVEPKAGRWPPLAVGPANRLAMRRNAAVCPVEGTAAPLLGRPGTIDDGWNASWSNPPLVARSKDLILIASRGLFGPEDDGSCETIQSRMISLGSKVELSEIAEGIWREGDSAEGLLLIRVGNGREELLVQATTRSPLEEDIRQLLANDLPPTPEEERELWQRLVETESLDRPTCEAFLALLRLDINLFANLELENAAARERMLRVLEAADGRFEQGRGLYRRFDPSSLPEILRRQVIGHRLCGNQNPFFWRVVEANGSSCRRALDELEDLTASYRLQNVRHEQSLDTSFSGMFKARQRERWIDTVQGEIDGMIGRHGIEITSGTTELPGAKASRRQIALAMIGRARRDLCRRACDRARGDVITRQISPAVCELVRSFPLSRVAVEVLAGNQSLPEIASWLLGGVMISEGELALVDFASHTHFAPNLLRLIALACDDGRLRAERVSVELAENPGFLPTALEGVSPDAIIEVHRLLDTAGARRLCEALRAAVTTAPGHRDLAHLLKPKAN